MTAQQKETTRSWLPTIVAVVAFVGQAIFIGTAYGQMEERLAQAARHASDQSLHMPLEKKLEMFITRHEVDQRSATRDREMADIRAQLSRIGAQVDALYKDRFAGKGAE